MALFRFLSNGVRHAFRGSPGYWAWLGFLALVIANGLWAYSHQLSEGLIATNMSSQVSWGFYIANFTYLVGVAAAAVLLVIPAYIFHRQDVKDVVLLGDIMAIAAVIMAILFVVVDLGRPDRIWHLLPGVGVFNFPSSMLAWDVVVLSGYLLLNLGISFYILYSHYRGRQPVLRYYFPFVLLAMFWAISIHTVTAFLFSANSGRPFWSNPLLAPRFIASAFASGPALSIIALSIVRKTTRYPVQRSVIDMLSVVMTVALQITLFFVGAELFTEFYNEGHHAASARYLFLGLHGHGVLVPWIWTGIGMLAVAVLIVMIHPLRRQPILLLLACVLTAAGVWIEKGMGLVIPGFVPTTMGEVYEYLPNFLEISVVLMVWAMGLMIFTMMVKIAVAVECGDMRDRKASDKMVDVPPACAEPEPVAS